MSPDVSISEDLCQIKIMFTNLFTLLDKIYAHYSTSVQYQKCIKLYCAFQWSKSCHRFKITLIKSNSSSLNLEIYCLEVHLDQETRQGTQILLCSCYMRQKVPVKELQGCAVSPIIQNSQFSKIQSSRSPDHKLQACCGQ